MSKNWLESEYLLIALGHATKGLKFTKKRDTIIITTNKNHNQEIQTFVEISDIIKFQQDKIKRLSLVNLKQRNIIKQTDLSHLKTLNENIKKLKKKNRKLKKELDEIKDEITSLEEQIKKQ